MAKRPVFLHTSNSCKLVDDILIDFKWNPGLAPVQKKKNINALHESAKKKSLYPLLEISTKSSELIGQRLSAFNLRIDTAIGKISIESAFQGSKVFEGGGPYSDIYYMSSFEAKKDERIKTSGKLIGFKFFDQEWPIIPRTAFYDWLYLSALKPHKEYLKKLFAYVGFTDIEFNPNKSINCQAKACALLVSLLKMNLFDDAVNSKDHFIDIVAHNRLSDREIACEQIKLY